MPAFTDLEEHVAFLRGWLRDRVICTALNKDGSLCCTGPQDHNGNHYDVFRRGNWKPFAGEKRLADHPVMVAFPPGDPPPPPPAVVTWVDGRWILEVKV